MVVDTGIFIEHFRAKDKLNTTIYRLSDNIDFSISAVTLYELYMGAISPEKETEVRELLEGVPVLAFTNDVAIKAAEVYNQLKKKNQLIEFRDIFIAATCLVNNSPLLTLNKKHFERIEGLVIV